MEVNLGTTRLFFVTIAPPPSVVYTPHVHIPLGQSNYQREDNCIDIILSRKVDSDLSLEIDIAVRSDGSLYWVGTSRCKTKNEYWHFDRLNKGNAPHFNPTKQQQHIMAGFWLRIIRPFGLSGLDSVPAKWALWDQGITPDTVTEFWKAS